MDSKALDMGWSFKVGAVVVFIVSGGLGQGLREVRPAVHRAASALGVAAGLRVPEGWPASFSFDRRIRVGLLKRQAFSAYMRPAQAEFYQFSFSPRRE
jgi:hypothetical protein